MKDAIFLKFLAIFLLLQACSGRNQKLADLSRVTDSVFRATERYEGQFGEGGGKIKKIRSIFLKLQQHGSRKMSN